MTQKWKATMPRQEPGKGKVQVVFGVKTDLGYRSEVVGEFDRDDVLPHWTNMCNVAAGQPPSSPWISVEGGNLPDPGVDVFIKGPAVHRIQSSHDVEIAGIFHGEWKCRSTGDSPKFTVTHYMPIPL